MLPTEPGVGLIQLRGDVADPGMLVIPPHAVLAAMRDHGLTQKKLVLRFSSVKNHSSILCTFV